MTRISTAVLGLALVVGGASGGCSNYDPQAHAQRDAMEAKWAGRLPPDYHEAKVGNRIYVAASKASIDKVQAGGKFALHQAAFGFGPNKETVIFESNKEGIEDLLKKEYKKRHPEAAAL